MLKWCCAALVLGLTACGGDAPLPQTALDLNRAGAEALAAGDLEAAGARLSVALEYHPEFVEALTNLALVELARANFERAEQMLERSRRLNPNIAQTHHGLGVLAEHRHQPDVASDHYREALAVDPGFAPARANLARLLFQAGLHEHALLEYRRLHEVAPDRVEGHFGLCASLIALGRMDEAADVTRRARARFGETSELRLIEGRLLLLSGRVDDALTHWAPLANHKDSYAVAALGWMSVAELAAGRPRRAVSAAERALRLEPDDPLATYALAVALDHLNDTSAPLWIERALLINPNNPELKRRASD